MATQTVVLFLHSIPPTQVSWTLLDQEGVLIETRLHTDLTTLTLTAEQELIVIIPAQDILLTYVELPKLSLHRLRQAIPFALEDTLINDSSESHFAVGTYKPENYWPVAVISQEKMAQLIESLDHFQLRPTQVIPVTLALPLTEARWTVFCLDSICFVRTQDYSGFSCEIENLGIYLDAVLLETTQQPTQIDIYSEHKVPITLKSACPIVHYKAREKKLIESLAHGIKTQPYINLLQGLFSTKRKLAEAKKFWVYTAYVTLAWVGLGFFSHLFALFLLEHQAGKIQSAIHVVYKRNFPDSKSMISSKSHMEEKLKNLLTQASNESFLILLANVSHAFSQNTGAQLKHIDYRDKQLTLEISANSFDDVDTLTQSLQQYGLAVKQQHAEIVSGRVKAALQINSGDA